MATSKEDLPRLTDGQLREIGRVAVNFNKVEGLVKLLVWQLLEIEDDDLRGVVTLGDSFAALVEKLKQLISFRVADEQLRERATEWLGYARKANSLRIDAVHAGWFRAPGSEEAIAFRLTKTGVRAGLLKEEDLRANADFIDAVAEKGMRLRAQLQDESGQD